MSNWKCNLLGHDWNTENKCKHHCNRKGCLNERVLMYKRYGKIDEPACMWVEIDWNRILSPGYFI
ncbi:MAG: hypothetical protein M0R51_07640 [Clostridia bacterium]|jgi:hypothetical protein|nr:hypothetical protein [Clostridia bacterium]